METLLDIQEGDIFHTYIDPEWLEFGCIPLNPVIEMFLPSKEDGSTIYLEKDPSPSPLIYNGEEEILEGEGVAHLLYNHSNGDFKLELTKKDPPTIALHPFWSIEDTKEEDKREEGLFIDEESIQRTFDRLKQGQLHSEKDYHLHQQASYFTLQMGFHELISLPLLRNLEPFDYQIRTAYKVLQDMRGRALLSDEVGLGKTIEAGLIMMEYIMRRLVKKILILVPPSLVEQWEEEMKTKFNLDFVTYDSSKFKEAENGWESFDRVIASIHTAKHKKHRQTIEEISYDLVIIDEAHHLKNRSTISWKFVNRLKKKYILLLTATPVQNKLEELFNLVTLLRPGQLATASEFKQRYITRGDRLKPKNPEELKQFVQGVMIRNKRSSNQILLTRRHARTISINLTLEEQVFYELINDTLKDNYLPSGRGFNRLVLKTIQRQLGSSREAVVKTLKNMLANQDLSQKMREEILEILDVSAVLTTNSKMDALVNLLKGIEDQAIIFTSFRETQRAMVERMEREKIPASQFHGQMRRAQKEEAIKEFRQEKKVLISTESGGEGRNLQFCNKMINYDLPWNPMRIEQRIGRIHRIGQTRDVYIYNMATNKTIEAYILELLDAKINMFELVIGELDMILGNLKNKKDFEDIVMDIWLESRDEDTLAEDLKDLGEDLLAARLQYQKTKEYDEVLFGEMFADA